MKMKQDEANSRPAKRKTKATEASLYDNAEIRGRVKRKAKEIEADLRKTHDQYPTLTRLIMPSHLAPRFKLSLPKEFCERNFPEGDRRMKLEGENERVYPVNYLRRKHVIGGGWRAVATDYGLEAGDVLVLQLMKPSNLFKVYIVRAKTSKEVDVVVKPQAGTSVVDLEESSDTNSNTDDDDDDDNNDNDDDANIEDISVGVGVKLDPESESGSDSNIELPKSKADDFDRVKRFEEFKIVVGGIVINGELSELLRFKYYQLCLSQKSFLHRDLLEGLNVRIISGMIADICDIVDAIRGMSKVVPKKDLETWGTKLRAFEKLGMEVGFLIARLRKLELLADKASAYQRLMKEKHDMKEELQSLEKQVGTVKGKLELVDKEIDKLGVMGSGSIDRDFIELANAPW